MTRVYLMQKWTLVILILGVSLLFNPFMNTDVFEFPKVVALIVCVGILTLINIFEIFKVGSAKFSSIKVPKILPELICISLLVISQVIAYIFSTDIETSLMGSPDRYQGFLTNIQYLLLFLNSAYIFMTNRESGNYISKWIAIVLFVSSLLAILPYVFPLTFPFYFFTPSFFFDRVYGTFGNPNYLSVFIVSCLPFLVFLKNFKRIFVYGGLVVVLLTLFLTGSRSAWVASIIAFTFVGILLAVRAKQYKVLMVVVVILATLLMAAVMKNDLTKIVPQAGRLSLDSEKSTSIQTRLYLWEAGIKMSLKKPLQGYGQDMIQENIEPYLPEYLKSNEEFFVDRSHNEFVDIFITTGALGGFSYLFLILIVSWRSFKHLNSKIDFTTLSFFTAFLSLVIFHGLNFSTTTSNALLYIFMGYLVAFYGKGNNNVTAKI